MPSPFPGMDPWLEDTEIFPDLHHSLIFLLREKYSELINYSRPCELPLTPEQQLWAEGLLRAKGLIS